MTHRKSPTVPAPVTTPSIPRPADLAELYQLLFGAGKARRQLVAFQSAVNAYSIAPDDPTRRGRLFTTLQDLNDGVDPGLNEDQILSFREMLSRDARLLARASTGGTLLW